jgi:diamine N-acetyltransferase
MTNPIYIRPIDIPDALIVMNWENNPANWDASDNKSEYQLFDIVRMIEENQDIQRAKQARWIICDSTSDKQIGTVDIFDINFDEKEAFVGVLIAEKENRQKGLASIAIELVENEGVKLGLERLKCVVHPGNKASVQLFKKREFVKIGETDRQFLNEGVYLEASIYEKWVKK